MNKILLSRSAKNKIKSIFIHPNEMFSIYFKNENEDVVWINGKVNLYNYLIEL